MGKKSRLKKERRPYEPPPIIAELLKDYFAADDAFGDGAHTALFRGQLVTLGSLFKCFDEEGKRLGIDEDELSIAWTNAWNTPPDWYLAGRSSASSKSSRDE